MTFFYLVLITLARVNNDRFLSLKIIICYGSLFTSLDAAKTMVYPFKSEGHHEKIKIM